MVHFKSLFCARFGCPESDYQERAFRALLYSHARPFASLARRLQPEFFTEDFKFIAYLSESTDLREAKAQAADFQDANFARRNFWRTRLKIRVSGRKATQLAQQLFSESPLLQVP